MDLRREMGLVAGGVKVGLVVGLLAFVVRLGFTDRDVVGGCAYIDVFAFIAAVVCAGSAWEALSASRRNPYKQRAGLHQGAAAVLVLLAAVHVLRGFGMILSPC